jgi:hypothetical protein
MECHPVLDTAGHVHVLSFRVDDPLLPVQGVPYCQHRRIANDVLDAFESGCFPGDRFMNRRHCLPLRNVRIYKYDNFD